MKIPARLSANTKTKKAVVVILAVIVVAVAVLFIRRPWAVAVLREGYPDKTWPAAGNFSQQGDVNAKVEVFDQLLEPSPEFLAQFDESEGSALLVVNDGENVSSHFAEGFSADTKFNSFSMVKSLVGVLALKAISEEKISSLDDTVGQLWPEAEGSPIAEVPLQNLLDMTSGISFEKGPGQVGDVEGAKKDRAVESGPFSNFARLHVEGVDEVLSDTKLVEADVNQFSYQNINTAIIGRILETVYGTTLDALLYEKIVEPSGAEGFFWRQHSSEKRISAYCCLYATAQWWGKVATFLMRNGDNDTFLNEAMFAYFKGEDLSNQQVTTGKYRSQIRYNILDREGEQLQGRFTFFTGLNGQMVYLIPEHDLVVVRFGQKYQPLHSTLYQISKFESSN